MDSRKTTERRRVAIIGAGIVGVSTAIWLQRDGFDVTIIDPNGPAGGTSYGNAGILAASSVVPVTVPGLWRKVPGYLTDPDAPLFLRWRSLPRLLPFLRRYMAHGTAAEVERISLALTDLLHDSAEQHVALAKGTGAERFVVPGDYLYGYADRAAFEEDDYGWKIRRKHGFAFEEMDGAALAAYDPALAGRFGHAVLCKDHGHVTDPGAYVRTLADHAQSEGARFVAATAERLLMEDDRAVGVMTSEGSVEADTVVLAAGVWSTPLAKQLGLTVPMEGERGYHIEFVDPSILPRAPIMVASGKFVITPMDGRLRCAGIAEWASLDAPPSRAPFDLLKRQTMKLLPELQYSRIEEWMGHRPSTTDSLPLIGEAEPSGVYTALGHQHVGLTAGPKTGRWIAQMIAGRTPNTNLAPFAPNRFTRAQNTKRETTS